jgi:ubiquinone/menaquinone biosynthesis C-methylase UbiE
MDAPGLPPGEVADAYHVLQRVNAQLGNRRSLLRELDRMRRDDPAPGPLSLLDVGSGSGDLPAALRDAMAPRGLDLRPVALDRDPVALALAARNRLPAVRADALRLPLADRSVDVVTAAKFAHHFAGPALERLLAEMARVARRRVIVLDIERHWAAYAGFVAWSRLFTRNRLVRHDGPLSVLRGFTTGELRSLVAPLDAFHWQVQRRWPFQLVVVGRRL